MKKIVYIVPYFGKFPINFQIWLNSCGKNSTIDWLIFTVDRRNFEYPSNGKVNYIAFEDFKDKIQSKYDFNITIDSYWRICLFRPAFGEIFAEYIKEYDDIQNTANMFLSNYFLGINSFDYLNQMDAIDVEFVTQVLNDVFRNEKMVISIIKD